MTYRALNKIFKKMGVTSVPANTTVQMACQIMAERNIAILFVTEHNTICGSFSERDLLMKVAAGKLDPTLTPLKSVMSPDHHHFPL
jgi:CBS domain-containing protein